MEAHISNDHIITDLNFLNNKIMFYMKFMYFTNKFRIVRYNFMKE